MERKALPAVFAALIGVFNVLPADGQARPTSTLVSRLVPAQCLTGGVPEPCNASGITLRTGSVRIRKLKQPGPVFKTSIGRVSLQAVSPAQTNVEARVSARITYGPDNDADPCPFANTQVFVPSWATSTMNCILSSQFGYFLTCVGQLHLSALMPASCANVDTTIEELSTEVYEAGFVGVTARLIATDGHAVAGTAPDCDSGGIGCP